MAKFDREEVLKFHRGGKVAVRLPKPLKTKEDLCLAYTPGVAHAVKEIAANPASIYDVTAKSNLVGVVSDGTAILGLGDLGAAASIPVMEGKAVLCKEFGGVNAVPICLDTQDTEEIIKTVAAIAPAFGGINLEDIAAPRCFEIEKRLKELCDIPIFHDDQHGTAVVVTAALINALKAVKKDIHAMRVVINGLGAAGTAIAKMLISAGVGDLICVDRSGIVSKDSVELGEERCRLLEKTNKSGVCGSLKDAIKNADVFIGVSAPNILFADDIKTMAKDAIVFAMANPTPEIMPDEAKKGGAAIVGTGRSDFPNQINNVLVFPGVFRGALDAKATEINEEMKLAAAYALASHIPDSEITAENIIPSALDKSAALKVAAAVKEAAEKSGVTRKSTVQNRS